MDARDERDRRPIRVAVIGPADLVAEVADLGRGFDGVEVCGLPYERVDQALALYVRAVGGTTGVGERAGAVLFTGPIGYRRAMGGAVTAPGGAAGAPGAAPAAAVPTAYVPYSPMWLYAPLFAVADHDSLRRVSLDGLDRGVLEATYREFELNLDSVDVYAPAGSRAAGAQNGRAGDEDPSPDEVTAFHRRAAAEGRATHALTCILEVYRRLRKKGMPCSWLVPSRVALAEALEKLLYAAEGARARGAQIVVGLARPRAPRGGSMAKGTRSRLRAREALLAQVQEFDGQLVDLDDGGFQFFATRARFERATDLYRHWTLAGGRAEAGGRAAAGPEMSVGVGLGATVAEAGVNAAAALNEAVRGGSGSNACFVMLENKRLIGPLGPGALAYHIRSTDLALLETAGQLGTAAATLQRALAALDGLDRDFTARDLAPRLRVGLRTAHRLLHKLREAGLVVEVGQESAGTRGRPRRVFRLGRAVAEAAVADAGEGGGRI